MRLQVGGDAGGLGNMGVFCRGYAAATVVRGGVGIEVAESGNEGFGSW